MLCPLNLICSASVIHVHGCVLRCWVGELFLGKVFQRVDATMQQGTGWLMLQLDESSPVFFGSQTQLNAPDHAP